jgi:nucleoside-diphosphate-sugar epimerase
VRTGSLLILGGTGFVGPAVVAEALAQGWEVTTFTRGCGGRPDPRVDARHGDRRRREDLGVLGERGWDLVLDTWSGAPAAVRDSAEILRQRAGRYVYISSCSVYAPPPPIGLDETTATVPASPNAQDGEYPELKRGAELAVSQAFGHRALLLRCGLILGPGEDVGRLPWWLERMARGGRVLCPGPADLALQYIDVRDLAAFALHAATDQAHGAINTVSPRGHATMGELLQACHAVAAPAATELVWGSPEVIAAAGIEPWQELPIWIPPEHEFAGMHGADVRRARAAGLHCRPVIETVADTWAWMGSFGPEGRPLRPDLPAPGLDPEREREVLETLAG